PPRAAPVVRYQGRPRTAAVHGPAPPVRVVVPRLEAAATRPVGHLVALIAGLLHLGARGVELVPREVGLYLGNAAFGAPAIQQRAFFEGEAVGGHMVGTEGDRAPQRVEPGLEVLIRQRVAEVDADVAEAHLAREMKGARRLRRVGLAF